MRKNRLVVEAAEAAGTSSALGGRIVERLLEGIVREVAGGGEVRLGLFGSFVCERRVQEGGRCGSGSARVVLFRPGKKFRDALRPNA